MKKLLVLVSLLSIFIIGVFAYSPSPELQRDMDSVVERLEEIIDEKGQDYRGVILSAIDIYMQKYSSDERAVYILTYLKSELSENNQISTKYMGSYSINDPVYGTEVEVVVSGDTRSMSTNALPNHDTGTFPNSGNPNSISAQDKNYSLDTTPSFTGNEVWARESGVAYNGIKFELETAEVVECTSGESYKIEAIQDMTNLGLDHNHAHVQPTGEYHYHGAAEDLIATLEGDDIVHVGYANDGFPLYYSKKGTYSASYGLSGELRVGTSCTYRNQTVEINNTLPDGTYVSDWVYDASGDLDKCNGMELEGEYVYFITDEYPYGPRCLNGEYVDTRGGHTPGGPSGGGRPPRR